MINDKMVSVIYMNNVNLLSQILYITEEQATKYANFEKLTVGSKSISALLVKELITDQKKYDLLLTVINNNMSNLIIRKKDKDRIFMYAIIDRSELARFFSLIVDKYSFNEIEMGRINHILNITSFEKFKSDYLNRSYRLDIDNESYTLSISDIIELLSLNIDIFYNRCRNSDKLYNINKEKFIYGVKDFIDKNKILKNYVVPQNIIDNYNIIDKLQLVDIEAINQYNVTNNPYDEQIKVNDEIKKIINSQMPDNLSQLEKAIYIYIKLCKMFTYDEEYYLNKDNDAVVKKHHNINYILEINPEHNQAICYELNAIYSSFLDDLGIKYQFNSSVKKQVKSYGESHEGLTFRYGKFIVNADMIITVFNGDLVQAKINQKLDGLFCKNKNKDTVMEFNSIVKKIYTNIILDEDKNPKSLDEELTFDDLIEEYERTTNQKTILSVSDKLDILISKVNSVNLNGLDNCAYLLRVGNIIFSDDNNIAITIIKNNLDNKATAIISQKLDYDNIKYYTYVPNGKLTDINNDELQNRFDNKDFEIINMNRVPGINYGAKRL